MDAAPAPHPALGPKEALLLQPQLCGTADPPRANITDFWYGTARPAANLRPELDTVRFSTLSLSPRGVGTVASWPVEVTVSTAIHPPSSPRDVVLATTLSPRI